MVAVVLSVDINCVNRRSMGCEGGCHVTLYSIGGIVVENGVGLL